MSTSPRGTYPAAHRDSDTDRLHGHPVADPYRWLEDAADPRTVRWQEGEEALFAGHEALTDRGHWAALLTSSDAQVTVRSPRPRAGRLFHTRQGLGDDLPVLVVSDDRGEHVLFDPSDGRSAGSGILESWHPSQEGDRIAVQVSSGGTEDAELVVLDVTTGETLDGPVDRVRRSSVAWVPGGDSFYYVRRLPPEQVPGEERFHRRVYLHQVGTDADDDVEVFGGGLPKTSFFTVELSADGRWLSVSSTDGTAPWTAVWMADLGQDPLDKPRWRSITDGVRAKVQVRFASGRSGTYAYALTDHGAQRGRLLVTREPDRRLAEWSEAVAERPDAVLHDVVLLTGAPGGTAGIASWQTHGMSQLTLHGIDDARFAGEIRLPGRGTVVGLAAVQTDATEAWFGYTDFTTPQRLFRYDAATAAVTPHLPATGPTPSRSIRTTRESCRSADGTEVGYFLITPPTGTGPWPTLLTAYGGFGVSMVPGFLPHILAWVRAGGAFVVAGVRGGREEGESWHRAGMVFGKQAVLEDFAAVADHLVRTGRTASDQLGALGGSNGGLMVAAAITRHPARFAAAAMIAPLTDMVRYEVLGIGATWRAEYGSVADPREFHNLLSYSPYHQVQEGTGYPAVLLSVAEADTRVDPAHARKFCAALQHASTSDAPILYRVERGVGHGRRPSSADRALFADVLAFFGHHLGLGQRKDSSAS